MPQGTGFINPGKYLTANAGAGGRMAGTLADDWEKKLLGAQSQYDGLVHDFHDQFGEGKTPQYAALTDMAGYSPLQGNIGDLQRRAATYQSPYGLSTAMGEKYGATTQGGGALDGFLASSEASGRFSRMPERADALGTLLGQANERGAAVYANDAANRQAAAEKKARDAETTRRNNETNNTPPPAPTRGDPLSTVIRGRQRQIPEWMRTLLDVGG